MIMTNKDADTQQLWENYYNDRSIENRNALIVAYLHVVAKCVHHRIKSIPRHVDKYDLYQVGAMSLFRAVERFDPTRNIRFETYVNMRILGAILDYLRDEDFAPRAIREQFESVKRAVEDYKETERRCPTADELAHNIGISDYHAEMWVRDFFKVRQVDSLEHVFGDNLSRMYAIEEPEPDELVPTADLYIAIKSLPSRLMNVIHMRYFYNLCFSEMGKNMGITAARASQLHKQALGILKEKLADLVD